MAFASKAVMAFNGVATSRTEVVVVFKSADASKLANGLSPSLDDSNNGMPIS